MLLTMATTYELDIVLEKFTYVTIYFCKNNIVSNFSEIVIVVQP